MVKSIKFTKDMTNKEIMYTVASEWIDDICIEAVKNADEAMSNPIVRNMIVQAAEHKIALDDIRKRLILGDETEKIGMSDFWYETAEKDWRAYETVLYDTFFCNYGANDRSV